MVYRALLCGAVLYTIDAYNTTQHFTVLCCAVLFNPVPYFAITSCSSCLSAVGVSIDDFSASWTPAFLLWKTYAAA